MYIRLKMISRDTKIDWQPFLHPRASLIVTSAGYASKKSSPRFSNDGHYLRRAIVHGFISLEN